MKKYKALTKHVFIITLFMTLAMISITWISDNTSLAKTKKTTVVCTLDKVITISKYNTIRSATIKKTNNNVRVRISKLQGTIDIIGKKAGSTTVTVKYTLKSGKKKTTKIKVKIISSKTLCKRAFKIQNDMRSEKGASALEWSDEAYKYALYRLHTSGYDQHKNMLRDAKDYFGKYYYATSLSVSENLASPAKQSPKYLMNLWKSSHGHYMNLLKKDYKCGAIARDKGNFIAVFFKIDARTLEGWKTYFDNLATVNVRIYDISSGTYLSGESFTYYDKNDKWGDRTTTHTDKDGTSSLYLEYGKTYVIFDSTISDAEGRVRRVEITIDEATKEYNIQLVK